MIARRTMKWLARLMLGLVLFGQGVVAANACVTPGAGAVQAFSSVSMADDMVPDACHEHEDTLPNANACLSHCTQSYQISADPHFVPLAAPVSVAMRVLPQPRRLVSRVSVPHSEPLAFGGDPPIPLRFCTFLN
jgi:hypothetical protein